ncbi:HNH endonuclease [Kamptonema cortianum]|uniref:HNH endonuclease n=1 Tax=Geitlerinema calcuttense NRMC-F 0142 TaxID=2922238 RepID=A0ABT7LYE9_9CYAN|nr:HNH endonuclease [Geitlerinema calcuttense]MCD8487512.1 HNH endonuclease [Desertifilum sp.]MDI9640229.1 HNH endonuclease [Geitlerinema splendidum]MDK3157399.1 HNH endonuclease [Kamptonema cortianum]NES94689.1 HNH endonuclease [Desertifilum sp. SIO1I2]MDL5057036.1 HNH endonuclease [Geitlerinema calcuttense NRMC-F 0142]
MQAQPPSPQPHILQKQVVVFSKNYLPLARINLKRAVVLLVTGQAESLELSNTQQWEIRSPSIVLQISEHIRLTTGNPERHWKVPAVSRREVFRRDRYTCQYCGATKHLTLDHVIPRSKGGTHTWDNVVTACEKCNSTKSDRLLHETGMTLKSKPKAPMHPAVAFVEQFWKEQHLADS